MTTPPELHAALRAALETTPHVTVFDGDVPSSPPADADGRVYPYAVLWPSGGGDPEEHELGPLPSGVDWVAQVTVAAGDPTWVLPAVTSVRAAVRGRVLVPFASRLVDETPRSRFVMRDPDANPPRWFLPMQFGCVTG